MDNILGWINILGLPIAISVVLGMMAFCASRWLLEKGGWAVRIALLVLAALGAGLICSFLRLTGLLWFPTDGAALLWDCIGPFAGVAWAFAGLRKQGKEKEEMNDGKQPN